MGKRLRFFVRCLMGGVCSIALLCMSCRHSPSSTSNVRTAVDATADKMGYSGIYHEVKQGQTLWGIARAYGVDVQTLARVNQVSDTTALYAGQKLYVPGATQQRKIVSRCPCRTETVKLPPSAKYFSDILRPSERSSVTKAAPSTVTNKEAFLE